MQYIGRLQLLKHAARYNELISLRSHEYNVSRPEV